MKELAVERAIDLKQKIKRARKKMSVVAKMSARSTMKMKNNDDSSQSSLNPKPSILNILNETEVAPSLTSEQLKQSHGAGGAKVLPLSFDHHAGVKYVKGPPDPEIGKENEVESRSSQKSLDLLPVPEIVVKEPLGHSCKSQGENENDKKDREMHADVTSEAPDFLEGFVQACNSQEMVVKEVRNLQRQVRILRNQIMDMGGDPFV
jgi:hypothetical protein